MNYKIISMDFDGTLLTTDKKVTERTKNKLLQLKNEGYIIIGITGRNLSSSKSVLDISIFDYLILSDGSYIYDVKNNNTIVENVISEKSVNDITNDFRDKVKAIRYNSIENYYMYKNEIDTNMDYIIPINDIEEIRERIGKINIFFKDDAEIYKYTDLIKNRFENLDALVTLDSDGVNKTKWIIVNKKGINKLETLKQLCLILNVSLDEVIFFGDSTNDLLVINNVGLGVAMGNALPEVKEKAKAVTLSNNDDGIFYFLEKL